MTPQSGQPGKTGIPGSRAVVARWAHNSQVGGSIPLSPTNINVMPNCKEYQELALFEQRVLIGSVIHLLQNDSDSFKAMCSMVRSAEQYGCLSNVVMYPEPEQQTEI